MDQSVEGAGRRRLDLQPAPDADDPTGSAAGEHVSGELCQCGADQAADEHVGGAVHPGMDAGVGDRRGERTQRDGGRRRHLADAGREGDGGVPRRERAREPICAGARAGRRPPDGRGVAVAQVV